MFLEPWRHHRDIRTWISSRPPWGLLFITAGVGCNLDSLETHRALWRRETRSRSLRPSRRRRSRPSRRESSLRAGDRQTSSGHWLDHIMFWRNPLKTNSLIGREMLLTLNVTDLWPISHSSSPGWPGSSGPGWAGPSQSGMNSHRLRGCGVNQQDENKTVAHILLYCHVLFREHFQFLKFFCKKKKKI